MAHVNTTYGRFAENFRILAEFWNQNSSEFRVLVRNPARFESRTRHLGVWSHTKDSWNWNARYGLSPTGLSVRWAQAQSADSHSETCTLRLTLPLALCAFTGPVRRPSHEDSHPETRTLRLALQLCSRNAQSCHTVTSFKLLSVCHVHLNITCSKSLIPSCNPF